MEHGPPEKKSRVFRPPKHPKSSPSDGSGRTSNGGGTTPLDNLPTLGREFCEWAGITDPQDLVDRRTCDLAEALREYRRVEGMPALHGSGNGAYVSMWKSQVRRELAFWKAPAPGRKDKRDGGGEAKGRWSPAPSRCCVA